jgi:hypothetical protein
MEKHRKNDDRNVQQIKKMKAQIKENSGKN